jgi:hypothetical protein
MLETTAPVLRGTPQRLATRRTFARTRARPRHSVRAAQCRPRRTRGRVVERTRKRDIVRTGRERLSDLGFPIHQPMAVSPAAPVTAPPFHFERRLVAEQELGDGERATWARAFFSGIGSRGAAARLGGGTDFLGGQYNAGSLNREADLDVASFDAVKAMRFETWFWRPAELRRRLDAGHCEQMTQKEWLKRFPAAAV